MVAVVVLVCFRQIALGEMPVKVEEEALDAINIDDKEE